MSGHAKTPYERLNRTLALTKNRARRLGYEFDLTLEWLQGRFDAQRGCCSATGVQFTAPPKQKKKGGCACPRTAVIDRIDSSRGYTMDNVQLVTSIYNYAKNKFTDQEVLAMARALVKKNQPTVDNSFL